uniref:SWIM-type domain-containing protein n=1 Tax=Fagus sylvatica TaxID=28930 RepID=A0A2N9FID4_FAGSY
MNYLKGLDEKAWKWLSKIPAKQWCKAYFTKRALSDCLVTNISESFNVMILPARDKLILSMLEWIRVRLMTRLHTKRIVMEKYGGSVCSNVQDKLKKLKMESRSFSAMFSGRFKYEVDNDYERDVVNLTKKECTCRIWDLTGIPCKHGVASIYKNCEHPKDYLHDCYLKEAYLDVYSEIIHPMSGTHVLRPLGRPKKLRRRDPDEPRNPHKPVSVRDSTGKGAGSGAGRGRGTTSGVCSDASRGATSGLGSGAGKGATSGTSRGSNIGAGKGSTSGQASGIGRGSISGQASGASKGSTSGIVV